MIYKLGSKGQAVKQIQAALNITQDGIYGKQTEQAVKQFQIENNLEPDGIVGPRTWAVLFNDDIEIRDASINTHISYLPNRKIKYIALHFTAGATSKYPAALSTRNVFLKRNASADFVVDDSSIIQINPDIHNYYCWAVGDKKNPYSSGGQLYGIAKNSNTVSIEICSNLRSGRSAHYPNTSGWYFTDASIQNALKLTKHLMRTLDIPKSHVVRHYDISGKYCPGIIGWNLGSIYDDNGKTVGKNTEDEWLKFKSML